MVPAAAAVAAGAAAEVAARTLAFKNDATPEVPVNFGVVAAKAVGTDAVATAEVLDASNGGPSELWSAATTGAGGSASDAWVGRGGASSSHSSSATAAEDAKAATAGAAAGNITGTSSSSSSSRSASAHLTFMELSEATAGAVFDAAVTGAGSGKSGNSAGVVSGRSMAS